MAISILEVTASNAIPSFAPFGVLYYAQDTGDLWIGTGFSTGSDYTPGNPGPNVNKELIASGGGGTPGGFNGDIQYNNLGAFGGSAATVDALGNINALSVTATTVTVVSSLDLQTAVIVDSVGSTGTIGQALESTGTGILWATVTGGGTSTSFFVTATIGTLTATVANIVTATVTNDYVTNDFITTATITTETISNSYISTLVSPTATITTATITGANIVTATVTNDHITNAFVTTATITTETISNSYISTLVSPAATITTLTATTATITTLTAPTLTTTTLSATTATVSTLLTAPVITNTTLTSVTATVSTLLNTPAAIITTATIGTDHVTAGIITTLTATTATISTLVAPTATITTLTATTATIKSVLITDTAANADLIVQNTTTATSSTTNASPLLELAANFWTGSASAADTWTIGSSLAAGTNGVSSLTFSHSGSSGAAQVAFPAGSSGAPGITFAANPSMGIWRSFGSLVLEAASGGNTYFYNGTSSSGYLDANNNFVLDINGTFNFNSDTAISRVNAGILGVGTGASGSIAGNIQCASIALNGAVASPTAGIYYSGTNAGITQSAIAVGTIGTTGGIVTTFTGVSDERLKKFTEYGGGLAEILNIVPIRYRWNEAGQKKSGQTGDRDYVGFSAQNVQKSIPEAIQGAEGEEQYLSFDDRPVIAALCNAVKELTARIKILENQLK